MAQGSSSGHGARMSSWLISLVILIGFIVGGIALVIWNWPLFWVAVGVTVVSMVIARMVGIMDDVTEYGGGSAHDPQSASS